MVTPGRKPQRVGPRPGPGKSTAPRSNRPGPASWPESSCSCRDCRRACLNSPGWFLPGQLEPLATFLELPLEEVFGKVLAIGTTAMPDRSRRHGVMPHKYQDRKKPGTVWTLPELAERGRCVFYDRGRCTIYPVRPFECSRMLHSRASRATQLRHHIVKGWTPAALRPFLAWARRKRRGGA